MARHLSWIDNDKLSNLFNRVGSSRGRAPARARAPVAPPPAAPPPAAPPVQARVSQASAVRAPAVPPAPSAQPAVVAPVAAAPLPDPFAPSAGTELYARVTQYLDWAVDAASLHGLVLADGDGLVIAQREGGELEAAMTLGLGTMLQMVGDILFDNPEDKAKMTGHVALEFDGRHLVTLWAPTTQGNCYGVLIGDSVPAGDILKLVQDGLRVVFAD